MRVNYTFSTEPRDNDYRRIVDVSARFSPLFLLVARRPVSTTSICANALRRLHSELVESAPRSEWPGTQLHGHTAEVFTFTNSETARTQLKMLAEGLYDWVEPNLPEDLSFVRHDGSAWLTTISHERDSYLTLDSSEYALLLEHAPWAKDKLLRDG